MYCSSNSVARATRPVNASATVARKRDMTKKIRLPLPVPKSSRIMQDWLRSA